MSSISTNILPSSLIYTTAKASSLVSLYLLMFCYTTFHIAAKIILILLKALPLPYENSQWFPTAPGLKPNFSPWFIHKSLHGLVLIHLPHLLSFFLPFLSGNSVLGTSQALTLVQSLAFLFPLP